VRLRALQVKASMARLKSLNPRVRVVLATDNLELSGVADRVDLVPASTGWTARVKYMTNMSVAVPECDVTISLDSHARVCGTDLFERLATFYDSGALFGSNIEHAPYPGWSSSGLLIEQARANARSRRHLGAISVGSLSGARQHSDAAQLCDGLVEERCCRSALQKERRDAAQIPPRSD